MHSQKHPGDLTLRKTQVANAGNSGPVFHEDFVKFSMDKNRLEEVAAFLREHRSNESNFETLYKKLQQEMKDESTDTNYAAALHEANEKAAVYRKAKENGGAAWPEFENFVSDFEKAVTEAAKAAD